MLGNTDCLIDNFIQLYRFVITLAFSKSVNSRKIRYYWILHCRPNISCLRLHPVLHQPILLLTSSCASHEHVCGSANVPGTYTQCDWLFSPAQALVQIYTPDSRSKSVKKRMSFINNEVEQNVHINTC